MRNSVRFFRWAAIAEACSWAGLLVGMFFKYVVVHNDIGVKIFGPIHGGLFVLYVLTVVVAAWQARWGIKLTGIGLLAAVPPFTTLLFERYVIAATQPGDKAVKQERNDVVAVG